MKTVAAALFALLLFCSPRANAQNPAQPGRFDFYLLNLSWAPEFCAIRGTADECRSPHGFVEHGLWPQNLDGSYPADCEPARPGPAHPKRNLDITPDLKLLEHEWSKHGTCTTLSPDDFFSLEHQAYRNLKIPHLLEALDHEVLIKPAELTELFQKANPGYPAGSILVSCGHNRLTAVEACLSRDGLKPMVCQGLRECHAEVVRITPEPFTSSGLQQNGHLQ